MILIFTQDITERVSYTFKYIFGDILKTSVLFTASESEFLEFKGAKLVYGHTPVKDFPFFQANHLLFSKGVTPQNPEVEDWEGVKVLFPVKTGLLPFDIFSATFYLITRYEEYLPHTKDKHNRFDYKQSLAYKAGFLEKPIINIWVNKLREVLSKELPDLLLAPPVFSFTPTIDIDNQYAYQHKGFVKNGLRLLSQLFSFQFKKFKKRLSVLARLEKDPYDSYDKQEEVHRKYNIKPIYFFLLGNRTRFDRNLSHKNKAYVCLINRLKAKAEIGLHPSYGSNRSIQQLKTEKIRLEKISSQEVTKSRQHYIKLKFPETYQNLITIGIKEDYSMGYPSVCGFRAGTATPFHFYNLQAESATDLKVYPFAFMDTTLKVYMKKRSKEIIDYIKALSNEVKSSGGDLYFIFHNESIGGKGIWKNWQNMYEKVIQTVIKDTEDV